MPAKRKKKPAKAAVPLKRRKGKALAPPLRWNLQRAAREFGAHRETLEKQRRALVIEPGPDQMFTTAQICAMVYGDKQRADITRAQEDAIAAQRRNARESGELIPTAKAVALVEPIMVLVRQKICASSMTEGEKDEILADLERAGEIDWAKACR